MVREPILAVERDQLYSIPAGQAMEHVGVAVNKGVVSPVPTIAAVGLTATETRVIELTVTFTAFEVLVYPGTPESVITAQ
jgi:hypothetical protein